jgi:toxin ParE1/3/4
MKNIKFSKQASQDIEEIYLYGFISFGEEQADLYALKMQKFLEMMRSNSKIGRLDTRVNPAIRRFDFENHVIFYDVNDATIIIVRILHGSMDFVKHLLS